MGIVDSPNGRSRKKKGRRRSKRIGFHLVDKGKEVCLVGAFCLLKNEYRG